MKGSFVGIVLIATLLTACGGGGGGSSTSNGTNNNFSSITISSSASSISETAVAPADINLIPGAGKFTISWNQLSGQNYNLFIFDSPSCTPAQYSQCPNAIKTNGVSSPYTPTNLENKKNYWVYLEAARGTNSALSVAQFVRSDNRVFDSTVNAIQVDKDGTTYLAGDFNRHGLPIGHGYVTDAVTGMPQKFPFIDGYVRASVSDGKGGWYIGGEFMHVESQQRTYLAHILPDGSLDTWSPALNDSVTALNFVENTLYVGGVFTRIDNKQRNGLAAFTSTGALTDWAPSSSGFINAIALFNNKIYVAGQFNAINSSPRENLAAINKDGTTDSWMPILDGIARTLVSTNDRLYVGGSFTEINRKPRTALAAFDKAGSLTDWSPQLSSNNSQPAYVSAMVELSSLIYIAGGFGTVNGLVRINMAALDADNKLIGWHPEILKDGMVSSMSVSGGKIYAGGTQLYLKGNNLYNLVTIDTEGAVSSLPIPFSHRIYSLSTFGDKIFLGGELGLQDAKSRNHLASLDKDGNLTSWSPFTNGYIYSLALSDDLVYVSGTFSSISGIAKSGLAAITKGQTGNLVVSATPDVIGHPLVLARSDKKLYIVGSFSSSGFGNAKLAAVDLSTGKFLDWTPSISGEVVYSLAATDQHVYVGGQFQSVNGEPRFNVASFNAAGELENWSPKVNGNVSGITAYQQTIYLSGGFQSINGKVQAGMAALGLDGNLQPFESKSNIFPQVSILNGKLYYGSYYEMENGMIEAQVLRADLNGKDDGWSLKLGANSYVKSLVNDGTSLYIGGSFSDVNGKYTGPFLKVTP